MYELIQVSDRCFYVQSPAKIGIVKTAENRVVLIDSGNDKDAGKKVKRILDANGWSLDAIYNTHSHADHIGGNSYLQKQTGCPVYAPGIERDFTEHPFLEPSYLYGGDPPEELRHKFLMAQPSCVLPLTEDVLPEGMEMIPLPGHSWDMVGFRISDGTVFIADSLASRETLEKYQVSFLTDPGKYLETLDMICGMEASLFIPSHAEPAEDIRQLAEYNMEKVRETADTVEGLCGEGTSFENLLKGVFEHYGLKMDFEQHALVGSTVRSYLSWLKKQGKIDAGIKDNVLIWHTLKK